MNSFKFLQACDLGRVEELRSIFSSLSAAEKNELIKLDRYAGFHIAAAKGHVGIIDFIFDQAKKLTDEVPADEAVIPIFLAREGEGFTLALTNKHIKVVEAILKEEYLFNYCEDIILENYVDFIWNSDLRNFIFYLFAKCCGQNISSVQRIVEIVPQSSHHLFLEDVPPFLNKRFLNLNSFEEACGSGKQDIVQLLWDLTSDKKPLERKFTSSFLRAVKNGHLEVIKQLVAWAGSELLTSEDYSAFIYAADKGYLEIVQFIWESLPPSLQLEALAASNFAAYRLATKNQHSHVVSFFEVVSDAALQKKMKNAVNQGIIG